MTSAEKREHIRRLKIRAAALERHKAARDPDTGKSSLAVSAGQRSGLARQGDRAWAIRMAIKRWYPPDTSDADKRQGAT